MFGDDVQSDPKRTLVLMGGGPEVDEASRLFVEAAEGGDIRILRATGSVTSYPSYFTNELAPAPAAASVATIRTDDPSASTDTGVHCQLDRSEAVWMAGGNQADYVFGWSEEVHRRLSGNDAVVVIGGTSAGAMVMGEVLFDARLASVTSETVLQNPTASSVTISRSPIGQPELRGMIVDTHFSEREREGRLLGFMARTREFIPTGRITGIGLDERSALVIRADSFQVMTTGGAEVHLYAVDSGEQPRSAPLSLGPVLRMTHQNGSEGSWPPQFIPAQTDTILVRDGVIDIQ